MTVSFVDCRQPNLKPAEADLSFFSKLDNTHASKCIFYCVYKMAGCHDFISYHPTGLPPNRLASDRILMLLRLFESTLLKLGTWYRCNTPEDVLRLFAFALETININITKDAVASQGRATRIAMCMSSSPYHWKILPPCVEDSHTGSNCLNKEACYFSVEQVWLTRRLTLQLYLCR